MRPQTAAGSRPSPLPPPREPVRLDRVNQCLWRGSERLTLTPKAFALLCELARHPGQLVTKEQLLRAVWPSTVVSEGVVKVCILEIRKALGDGRGGVRFVETLHRRGYRLVGSIAESREPWDAATPEAASAPARLVGREAAFARMQSWLRRALRGERQIAFVTGEQGIGKTTLVEAFAERTASTPVRVAHGQCLEHYGSGEAYLPILEALGRLCREPDGERTVSLLRRHAPTWLIQLPSLVGDAERERLQRDVMGATRERMLREMAEAVEALTQESPLVLVLEDLHWSDTSSVDLISSLAHRRERARLLLLGTYRPAELASRAHPLRALVSELRTRRKCDDLALEFLSEADVAQYLRERFPGSELPEGLAQAIHRRTDGNPLFMVNVVDHLLAQGWIGEHDGRFRLDVDLALLELGVPEDLRQTIEKQIDRLSDDERHVLEAASVAGVDFAAAAVAFAIEADPVRVEDTCDSLSRRHSFLRPAGTSEWADGTATPRYAFTHSFHANVLYHRLSLTRRLRLHQRIGERGETAYRERVHEIAAELAVHFEQARDYRRAIHHLLGAAANDARRLANREAVAQLERAQDLTEWLPEPARADARMEVLEQLGLVRRSMGAMGEAAADFEALAACARERGQIERETHALLHLPSVLYWVDRARCLATVDRVAALSGSLRDELLRAHVRGFCGHWNLHLRGWRADHALACSEAIDAATRAGDRGLLGIHVVRQTFALSLESKYEAACDAALQGERLAIERGDAFDRFLGCFLRAWALRHLGRWGEMLELLAGGIATAETNAHDSWATLLRLELADLHLEAFSFAEAREICSAAIASARRPDAASGQILHHALALLGGACTGLGLLDEAARAFDELEREIARDRSSVDWILQLPLHEWLGRFWLARHDDERAAAAARRVCELALQPNERTYLALGHRTLAEVHARRRAWKRAEDEIERAIAAIGPGPAPLAAWRVHATAADVHRRRGRASDAEASRERSAVVVRELVDSLGDHPLRATFAGHPAVKAILGGRAT
jgi:DNA-binding winged helix-turn-helix (wHTH) protein